MEARMGPEEKDWYVRVAIDALRASGIIVKGACGGRSPTTLGSGTLIAEGVIGGGLVFYHLDIYPLTATMDVTCAFDKSREHLSGERSAFFVWFFNEIINHALRSGFAGAHVPNALVRVNNFGPMVSVQFQVEIPDVSLPHRLLKHHFDGEVFPLLDGIDRCIVHFKEHVDFCDESLRLMLSPRAGRA
jgi:hypothetical protein